MPHQTPAPRLTGGGNVATTAANADGGGARACSGECDIVLRSGL